MANLKLAGVDAAGLPLRAAAYGHDTLMELAGLPSEQWGPKVDAKLQGYQQQQEAIAAQDPTMSVVRLGADVLPAALGGAGVEALAARGLGAAGEALAAGRNLPVVGNALSAAAQGAKGLGHVLGSDLSTTMAAAGKEAPNVVMRLANAAGRGASQGVGAQLATAGTNTPTPG